MLDEKSSLEEQVKAQREMILALKDQLDNLEIRFLAQAAVCYKEHIGLFEKIERHTGAHFLHK